MWNKIVLVLNYTNYILTLKIDIQMAHEGIMTINPFHVLQFLIKAIHFF